MRDINALDHIGEPIVVKGIFLNQGILECPGSGVQGLRVFGSKG